MSKVLDQSKSEVSTATSRDLGANRLTKIGNTRKTPKMIWLENINHPRRVNAPTKLVSREITGADAESIMHVIKSSAEFLKIVKLHLRHNSSA